VLEGAVALTDVEEDLGERVEPIGLFRLGQRLIEAAEIEVAYRGVYELFGVTGLGRGD
jgi:hypothetical protein